ncbi:MAG: LysR family transcriptional regulator [Pseudomonadota bacterium]
MNWNDIPVFLAIADAQSLAGAARQIGVNHSTVFRRLKALEASLGARLFDRLAEGYRLTALGESMLEPARAAQAALDEALRRVSGQEVALQGLVRITAPANLAASFLPELLVPFRARYPEIRIEIAVSDADLDLTRREADIALRATPKPPEHLVGRLITRLRWYATASSGYLERNGQPEDEAALAQHALIGADDEFSRLRAFRWLRERFPSAITWTANQLNTMAALARAGAGIALLPGDQDQQDLRRLFPVCPEATGELWLLTHPDLRQTARVRVLVDHLVNGLRDHPRLRDSHAS